MPNLPSGWFEYVDDTSGKPYYYHQASNVTTWECPVAPIVNRSPQVKAKEATHPSESSGSLPGGLLSQIQVGAKLKKVAVKAPEASSGVTPSGGSNSNSLFAELAAAKLRKTSASPHPASSLSPRNSSSPVAQNGAKGAGFADIMRKNRESAAAKEKANLASLTSLSISPSHASNYPQSYPQSSSTASISTSMPSSTNTSAFTSASNSPTGYASHNGGRTVAMNSSSQQAVHLNGSDKTYMGTNKPAYLNNNINTNTVISTSTKAVTPGVASRTRATPTSTSTPVLQSITTNKFTTSPLRNRAQLEVQIHGYDSSHLDEVSEGTEVEGRDRNRDRDRHVGGGSDIGGRVQSYNINHIQNNQNLSLSQNGNHNQNGSHNGRSSCENRHAPATASSSSSPSSDVTARLQSIEIKLDRILKHLGI